MTGGSGGFSNDTVTRTALNGFLYPLAESGLGHKDHPRLVWLSSAGGLQPFAAGLLTCFSGHGGDTWFHLFGEPKLPLSERGALLVIAHALVLLLRDIGECALCPRGAVCASAMWAASYCRREPGNRCEMRGRGGRQVYVLTKDSACGRMFLLFFQSGCLFSEVLHPLAR